MLLFYYLILVFTYDVINILVYIVYIPHFTLTIVFS